MRLPTAVLLAATQLAMAQPGIMTRTLRRFAPARPAPVTEKQRLRQYLAYTFGVFPLIAKGTGAGLSQWIDSPPEWGQGGEGYARRLGNHLAYNAVRGTLTYTTSVAFHEDNRYFASGKPSVRGRILHALISPVVAHHANGRDSLSYSSVTGIAGASLISRAWSPPSWQGASNIGASIGLSYASTAGFNVFREFVPDLIRALRGR